MLIQFSSRFLLARLHMDNLATKQHVRAIRDALKVIPRKLEDTYDLVMQRISEQNEDDADLARRVLSWLTYSVRPLTVTELQHALAVQPGHGHIDSDNLIDEEIMLSVCAGIVTVEDKSNLIRFIHYTTQEYLERIRDTRFPNARLEITKTCIEYLQLGAATQPRNAMGLFTGVQSWRFNNYAAMNWGAHADKGVEKAAETKILSFLKNSPTVSAMALKHLVLPRQCGPHVASYFGLSHILECQIKAGVDSEACDSRGQTPLHIAVSRNHRECVRILLEDDKKHGNKFHRAWILLRISAIRGLPELARLATESGADLFSQPGPIAVSFRGWTVLHEAVLAQHTDVIELLCDSGFDVESTGIEGNSALYIAATEGWYEIVGILVRQGADINKRNKWGETPLHHATASKGSYSVGSYRACTQLLLESGADVNCMDNKGRTPLYWAFISGEDTVELLLEKGGCLNLSANSFNLLRNIARSSCSIPLLPTVINQGGGMSLDQVKEKYLGTAKVLREERLERLNSFWESLNPLCEIIDITFEGWLKIDDDGHDTDSCFQLISHRLMRIPKYRSSWCVISHETVHTIRGLSSRMRIIGSSETYLLRTAITITYMKTLHHLGSRF
jgi:ankyrin repeat protein